MWTVLQSWSKGNVCEKIADESQHTAILVQTLLRDIQTIHYNILLKNVRAQSA